MSAQGRAEQSFALDSSSVFSVDPHGDDCKRRGDHTKVSTMVLSETHAHRRGLTLVLVIRGGLWLGECLGETAGQANGPAETHPRTIGSNRTLNLDAVARTRDRRSSEPYVVCIVSFAGSQSSPFFHSRNAIEAILRVSVSTASSGLVPRAMHAS